MPIRTLRDLDLLEGSSGSKSGNGGASSGTNGASTTTPTIHHIPDLPDADSTLAMLRRIHREFDPIIQRRGYRVLSISEMCCCGDGLDYESAVSATATATRQPLQPAAAIKKRRTRRIMASNILGYNQTRGRVHTIHLRLREARNHNRLFCYEDVAGTMAHELAHCEHSAHNAQFYKLMDEILEQHAVLLARGFVADKDGFPMNSSQAYVLGHDSARPNRKNVPTAAAAAARAADQRRQRNKWMPQGPQVLGGDNEFRKILGPQEAAGMAAELRRLRDEQWCHPCENDSNDLLDSDEDENDNTTNKRQVEDKPKSSSSITGSKRKLGLGATKVSNDKTQQPISTKGWIDLTGMDTEDDEEAAFIAGEDDRKIAASDAQQWPCSQCTYVNRPLALVCGVCECPRLSELDSEEIARALLIADEVQRIKDDEIRRSEEQFGFNIYGKSERTSRTMKHLT